MLVALLFGALVSGLTFSTVTFEDCKKLDFEPKACKPAKVMHDLGEKVQK